MISVTPSATPADDSLLSLLRRFYRHLSAARRRELGFLLGLMFVGAMAELVTLGAVVPFLAVLFGTDAASAGNPAVIDTLIPPGLLSAPNAVYIASGVLITVALLAATMSIVMYRAVYKYVFAIANDFGIDAYRKTLYQPYSYHLNQNSSDVIAVTNSTQILLFYVLLPFFEAFLAGFVAIFIILALLVIDASSALIAGSAFAAIYLTITRLVKPLLNRNSVRIAAAQTDRVKSVQEGLGDIRDILLDGTQEAYVQKFAQVETGLRQAQAVNFSLAVLPRFAAEGIGIMIIVSLALWLSRTEGGIIASLPVLGALALGAQRLLPLAQKVYAGWSRAAGSRSVLLDVLVFLDQEIPPEFQAAAPTAPVEFEREIRFDHLTFRYTPDGETVLDAIDLAIAKGERIGVVGKTGSGKSTLMDLLMGLIAPSEGAIRVDGVEITRDNRRAWQAQIAHVPQAIFLSDGTIAENIALGRPREAIDMARVRECAERAQLTDLIGKEPDGYDTIVGERGVRLSGGQRQRIGIARALYKRASVLIFDEATSALDDQTERHLLSAIAGLKRDDYTMIFVTHQQASLGLCDRVVELGEGHILSITEQATEAAGAAGPEPRMGS
ncbi:ABC transporter ATP-binding protein [Amorphus orientalis]|uniref:ATP-binding cassette subfamily B protein n=1 Tax=Amorphus orientalis TaxID=649198 RepID=A0AAE3VQQ8_9HYPH|nr:ABC transporter ATP-binding protein [Amorphus orientalis]MDQ0316594.1 ATP-binding cassette subfamily B protein [Amorphus orientalis]